MNKLDGTTHWEGCAKEGGRAHYDCAVARIAQLESRIAALIAEVMHYTAGTPHPRVAQLEAALEKYGQHLRGCKREDMLPCSCGFFKVTQASDAGEQK
jgi:hypothetical protein